MALILLETLVLAVYLPSGLTYDLLIPLVVYLSFFHPNGRTILLILFLGLIVDGLTGGAMGVYALTYFWIFAGAQLVVHYLQKDNLALMASVILAGILLEYAFLLTVAGLSGNALPVEKHLAGILIGRMIVAGTTGPVMVCAFKWLYGGKKTIPDIAEVDLSGTPERKPQGSN
ncbi:MAG: rod shape-determining protein MreD [Thermodesulfobacteriota bacterium]